MRSAAAILLCISSISLTAKADQPNVLLIYTDDHGYSDMGCQGVKDDLKTPNIDALAASGVRMTNGYVTAPQCVPSRGGLLAGRYQNRFGLESNTQFTTPGGMNGFKASLTIAERLQKAGYVTGMAGKWHLGPGNEIPSHGFDKFFYRNSGRPGLANITIEGKDQPVGQESSGLYHLDACSAVACSFIRRYQDQPFFFYLAYRAPHVPLDPPRKYLDRFPGEMPERRRKALAMLSSVDDGIGQIVETLRSTGIEKRTLIFFISDNGAPLKIHKTDAPGNGAGWDGSLNDPLNGEKGMLTEGGIRTPFVVSWKGTIPGRQIFRRPVISLDVAATANSLAGLPDDPQLDGVNLIPFLTGKSDADPHDALFWRWNGQAAIRSGDWKLLTGGGRKYLFDLSSDQEETKNLLADYPEVAGRLEKELSIWSDSLKPPGLTADLSRAATSYFDWYLDGKRDAPATELRKPPRDKPKRTPLTPAQLFALRDVNQDGMVTLVEFLKGRTGDTQKILERRFRAFDTDKDGTWSRDEVEK